MQENMLGTSQEITVEFAVCSQHAHKVNGQNSPEKSNLFCCRWKCRVEIHVDGKPKSSLQICAEDGWRAWSSHVCMTIWNRLVLHMYLYNPAVWPMDFELPPSSFMGNQRDWINDMWLNTSNFSKSQNH